MTVKLQQVAQLPASPTYQYLVDGRRVCVYDGLIDAATIAHYYQTLSKMAFARKEFARPATREYKHWVAELSLHQGKELGMYQPSLQAAAALNAVDGGYQVIRNYCNYASYGDMLFTHVDCAPGAGHVTALWYICTEWDVEWGGETILFNSGKDAVCAISPKPGRLVVFDGAVPHVGRPPNRICYAPRYTFAYKLAPQPASGTTVSAVRGPA